MLLIQLETQGVSVCLVAIEKLGWSLAPPPKLHPRVLATVIESAIRKVIE